MRHFLEKIQKCTLRMRHFLETSRKCTLRDQDMQYRHAKQMCNADMQQKACNTDMQ